MTTEDERPDAQIIDLTARRPAERAPVIVEDRSGLGCRHTQVTVDPTLRIVTCTDCKVRLDPVQVLIEQAYHHRRTDFLVKDQRKIAEKEQKKRDARAAKQAAEDALPRCGATSVSGLVCNLAKGHMEKKGRAHKRHWNWNWSGERGQVGAHGRSFGPGDVIGEEDDNVSRGCRAPPPGVAPSKDAKCLVCGCGIGWASALPGGRGGWYPIEAEPDETLVHTVKRCRERSRGQLGLVPT